MSAEALLQLLQQQIKQQQEHMQLQLRQMQEQDRRHSEEMKIITSFFQRNETPSSTVASSASPSVVPQFCQFDSSSELWSDYWARFITFTEAHSVPDNKKTHIFLTNQSTVVYKMLANLAKQRTPPTQIHDLTLQEISDFMEEQFHPKRFIVRERFKYWSKMDRKPGETIQELVARIRQDAITCDFTLIKDPLDEAL